MPADGGARDLFLFNPGWAGSCARSERVVLHRALLDRLLDELRLGAPDGRMTHHLIVGPPGSGKSTLLHHLRDAIEETPALKTAWLPLLLPLDYAVWELDSLWRSCLSALPEPPELPHDADVLMALQGEVRARGKHLLLLVDDVSRLLERLSDEHGALRRALSMGGLTVIGADDHLPEGLTRYDAPFFDFFSVDELRALPPEEVRRFLRELAARDGAAEVQALLSEHPDRIEPLRILSGGTPRVMAAWYQARRCDPAGSPLEDLLEVLDRFTPSFEACFEQSSPQQQRILYALCLHWHPVGSAALAARVGLKSTTVSGQLERMVRRRLVEKVPLADDGGLKKKLGYQSRVRLLNLWCLMRSGDVGRRRVAWMVDFLSALTDPGAGALTEARERALQHLRERRWEDALPELRRALEELGTEPDVDVLGFMGAVGRQGYAPELLTLIDRLKLSESLQALRVALLSYERRAPDLLYALSPELRAGAVAFVGELQRPQYGRGRTREGRDKGGSGDT